jgi:hypothetical protein
MTWPTRTEQRGLLLLLAIVVVIALVRALTL